MKSSYKVKQKKYEMEKRKEMWKALNAPSEKLLMIPLEAQPAVVGELVNRTCYNTLCRMLDLPAIQLSHYSMTFSVDTIIPYTPPEEEPIVTNAKRSIVARTGSSCSSTRSESATSSQYEYESISAPESKQSSLKQVLTDVTITEDSSDQNGSHQSDFVEVEKKIPYSRLLALRHKAIKKFLGLPEAEAATWRVKDTKDVIEPSEMTLEERGDFLINKISADFCEWMRQLGGDEKSFISEEILKELFQVGMDNPASRAISIKMREKRVLYSKLSNILRVPEKSVHEVLSQHLKWDIGAEKNPSKLVAFGKGLPKDIRFKSPKNKTEVTWLEWNKLTADQLSFADVYRPVKELRSTKEYCRWLVAHPEHKKPVYLVEQLMFERLSTGVQRQSTSSPTRRSTVSLGLARSTYSSKESQRY